MLDIDVKCDQNGDEQKYSLVENVFRMRYTGGMGTLER
jgi:hypothetical protein